MATTYNCEVDNFWGISGNNVTSIGIDRDSTRDVEYQYPDLIGSTVNYLSPPAIATYLENNGYSNVDTASIRVTTSGLDTLTLVFEDGSTLNSAGNRGYLLENLNSPLVDYYTQPIETIRFTFTGRQAGDTTDASKNHTVNFMYPEGAVWRSMNDIFQTLRSAGFQTNTPPAAADAVIRCGINGSGVGPTTSTVVITSPFTDSTITNVDVSGISDLETKVQANTDWIAAQPAFWDQVVNSLNNNVNGALDSSAQTRDLLVALQLSTIPNIESRLSALENE